jgi:hypothetical protein
MSYELKYWMTLANDRPSTLLQHTGVLIFWKIKEQREEPPICHTYPTARQGFSLNLGINSVQSSNSSYQALNWTVHSQAKACIVKSVCVNQRQKTARLQLTDIIFFFGTSIVKFFKEAPNWGSWIRLCFQVKKHVTWWTPLIKLFWVPRHHRTIKICT